MDLSLHPIPVHLLLAVGLFLLMNWIGQHSVPLGYMPLSLFSKADEAPAFNHVFRVADSSRVPANSSQRPYMASAFDQLVTSDYRVILYYFVIRILFNGAMVAGA